jgi:chromosomal replication initiator protein
MRNKLGNDIYESWLRKIDFVEEINNYLEEWITTYGNSK